MKEAGREGTGGRAGEVGWEGRSGWREFTVLNGHGVSQVLASNGPFLLEHRGTQFRCELVESEGVGDVDPDGVQWTQGGSAAPFSYTNRALWTAFNVRTAVPNPTDRAPLPELELNDGQQQ